MNSAVMLPPRVAVRALTLVRLGAAAALAGGVLRIASTFIPYQPDAAWLEALYAVIDICLVLGVVAVYLVTAVEVGMSGLALFVLTLSALASIVGPDAQMFGVDFYRVGAMVFVAGLAGFSVRLLMVRRLAPAAWLWLAAFGCGLVAAWLPAAFTLAGVVLGAGFVAAGVDLVKELRR